MEFPETRHHRRQDRPDGRRSGGPGRREDGLRRRPQAAARVDVGADARGADRADARGDGGLPGHGLLLQPAHRLPDRRARRRHAGPAHRQALRRGPGAPQDQGRGDRREPSAGSEGRRTSTSRASAGQPYITIRPDRAAIARLGLNVEDVQSVVETAVGGKTATLIYEGDRYFDLQRPLPGRAAGFRRGHRGDPRPDAGRGAGPLEPGRRDRPGRRAQSDQPRGRPAADRRRVQHRRPGPGRIRRRGPAGDRPGRRPAARLLPRVAAASSRTSSGPWAGWRSSSRPRSG